MNFLTLDHWDYCRKWQTSMSSYSTTTTWWCFFFFFSSISFLFSCCVLNSSVCDACMLDLLIWHDVKPTVGFSSSMSSQMDFSHSLAGFFILVLLSCLLSLRSYGSIHAWFHFIHPTEYKKRAFSDSDDSLSWQTNWSWSSHSFLQFQYMSVILYHIMLSFSWFRMLINFRSSRMKKMTVGSRWRDDF